MSADGRRLLDLLVDAPAQAAERERREAARWSFATATEDGLILDGDTEPMTDPPTSTVKYAPGDQVVVLKGGGRMAVVGNVTATGRYEPHLSLYTPPGYSHARWRNRVHAAKYGRSTTIAVIGSSSIAGVGATPDVTSGWAHRLRAMFAAAGYPIEGTGIAFLTPAAAATDNRWSMSGIATAWGSSLYRDVPAGAWAQFAADVPGTRVRVWYLNAGSAPFTVSVNGGAGVTVTPDGSSTSASWTSGALTRSAHTVRVTGSGPGASRIIGIECYDPGTPGITCTVGGLGATASSAWSSDWLSHESNLRNALARPAALALVAANGNDFTLGVPSEVTAARFVSIVRGLRFYGCEPLFVLMPHISGQDFDGYRAHASALYEVADRAGVAVIDMQNRWGSYALANSAGLFADGVHPSQRGHELYADAIFDVIGA